MKDLLKIFFIAGILFFTGCDNPNGNENKNSDYPFLSSGDYAGEYYPTSDWRECSPESVGMNSEKLIEVFEYLSNPELITQGTVIIKDGYIVFETYMNGFSKDTRHQSYSMAKSFNSALMGIAIDKGYINSVEEYALGYFTGWNINNDTELKHRIKIKHLLTMTGGLEWNEDDYSDQQNNDVFRIYNSNDFVRYVLDKRMINEPGSRWYYSSGESILLAGIIRQATGKNLLNFAREHLFNKIGIMGVEWESDRSGNSIGGWGVNATVREFAKFGYLFLRNGKWEDEQIISENWIEESTSSSMPNVTHYGYQWWFPSGFSNYRNYNIPSNTFIAVGLYTQRIYVVPEKNLVVVRVGNDFDPGNAWNTLGFLSMIIEAID